MEPFLLCRNVNLHLHFQAAFIAPHHMDDVIDERQISGLCGWVLCDEKLGAIPKQQYKIQNNKVLDITERKVIPF